MLSLTMAAAITASGVPGTSSPAVLELTSANWSSTVGLPHARVLVEFYLPWCGFCRKLERPYEEAAQELRRLRSQDPTLVGQLARVNAESERELASQNGAPPSRGYPSLFWFSEGTATEYRGGRSSADFVDFVLLRGGPLVTRLANASAAESFRLSFPVAVVATLSEPADEHAVRTLEEACRRAATAAVRCGLHVSPASNASSGTTMPSVVLHRATDDASVPYDGDLGATEGAIDRLLDFVRANELPPVTVYSSSTQRGLFDSSVDSLVFFLHRGEGSAHSDGGEADVGNEGTGEASWEKEFHRAAHRLRGRAVFALVDAREHGDTLMPFFDSQGLPAIVMYRKSLHRRYVLTAAGATNRGDEACSEMRDDGGGEAYVTSDVAPPTAEQIVAFVQRALAAGSAQDTKSATSHSASGDEASGTGALLRSEPALAQDGTSRPITMLVGSTFADKVLGMDASGRRNDYLVLLSAPWCMACHWGRAEVTTFAADIRYRMAIAEIDVSVNELPLDLPAEMAQPGAVLLFRADSNRLGEAELVCSIATPADVEQCRSGVLRDLSAFDAFLAGSRES